MDKIIRQLELSHQKFARSDLPLAQRPDRKKLCKPLSVADLSCDLSRQKLDDTILDQLLNLAQKKDFNRRRQALFSGEPVNETEQQPALYTALRADYGQASAKPKVHNQIADGLAKMAKCVQLLISGCWLGASSKPIRNIVHIGIGGSCLGPELACSALAPYGLNRIHHYYVSNMDGADLANALDRVHPEQTLFVVVSKSFTTQEVLLNAHSARHWLLERGIPEKGLDRHFIAVTAQPQRARRSGIRFAEYLPLWDWVPGRFSIWSTVSLTLATHIGIEGFYDFLRGASQMDQHFLNAPMEDNLPLLLALVDFWNNNVLGINSQVLLPYSERLNLLPCYIQQLQMESNGKRVSRMGDTLNYSTSKVVWGGVGTTDQHSYFQFLHQGTEPVAVDFILDLSRAKDSLSVHQDWLVSACLAQSEILAKGSQDIALPPHQVLPGGRPSTITAFSDLTPAVLGQLLALFEHRIFCQAVLWDINPFDQFGVDQGKRAAERVYAAMAEGTATGDQVTDRFLAWYNQSKS